ncbi:hypothetical protein K457DRAFT_132421 [Linnemannia elongata AG-77]|uniref:C2H2-type domain-containing protein n=1 Tax=Linnemannia elongata AG-77 TaxID=1314771 RepID=A0A197KDZ8_9FUNG|nr:hypothetical protein K457DRAFT_132421 [Linnemannia elongata AG-77]
MPDSCGSPTEVDSHPTHFAPSPQFDFTFLSTHDGKDHHVPAAIFTAAFSDNIPSLGLTGDANMDDLLGTGDQLTPRKRDRGERIVWTPEEDEFLRAAVQTYGDKTEKWAKIAACVPGRTNKNCRKRWFHSLDPSLKKGPWTEEEDHLLRTGVQKFKGQWSKIAERIQGRTDDQCAKRWREGLDPHIDRAAWTPEDDVILLQKFEEFGSQWQKIALSFPGRPGLHCRNRWRKIQRSLNHMKRTHKRRRNQSTSRQDTTETQRLEALMDADDDDYQYTKRAGKQRHSSDDRLHDGQLDEDDRGLDDSNDSGHSDQDDDRDDTGPDEDKPYGCAIPDCTFSSSSPSLLFYHFKASHHGTTVLKPFRCTMPGCEERKRYKNINGLQYHVTHAKNTPGHSGHGSVGPYDGHNSTSTTDAIAATTTATNSPSTSSGVQVQAPSTDILTPQMELQSFSFIQPQTSSLPTPPTTAEMQTIAPPLLKQQSIVSLQAFNIPHTPESLEDSVMSSAPLDASLTQAQTQAHLQQQLQQLQPSMQHHLQSQNQPQLHPQLQPQPQLQLQQQQQQQQHQQQQHQQQHQVQLQPQLQPQLQTHLQPQSQLLMQHQPQPHSQQLQAHHTTAPLQCPELGCGQYFHAIGGLNAHMATQHGHRSMTMAMTAESTDSFTVDSIAIPENDFDDMDIDLAYLASDSASPIEPSLLMLEDPHLQKQLDSLTRDHGALSLDPTTPDTEQDLSMLTMSEMLFASHVSTSLSSVGTFDNRIHFGSHINVSSDDPWTLPSTPVTSANVSPRMTTMHVSSAPVVSGAAIATAIAAATTTIGGTKPVVLKKFPCMIKDCPKSYGSNSALKVHMRNDHSGIGGAKAVKGAAPGTGIGAGAGLTPLDFQLAMNPQMVPSVGSSQFQAGLGSVQMQVQHVDPKVVSQPKAKPAKKLDEPSSKPYKCLVPGCGKGYTNINGLKNHLLQAHGSTPSKNA